MKNGQPVTDETREFFAEVAELPDLWDLTVQDWDIEMGISRFVNEGSLSTHTSYVKEVTSKPVVSVGRFTSPDTMVNQIKRGVIDLIGAARPSIADPFLPKKIEEGRIEDIRECIGCEVSFVCTDNMACSFELFTTEQPSVQRSLMQAGVNLKFSQNLESYDGDNVELSCMYTERESILKADAVVMVTARLPTDELYYDLLRLMEAGQAGDTQSIRRIGDCEAPAPIASAVYSGRRYALELDDNSGINYSLRRDANFSDVGHLETPRAT